LNLSPCVAHRTTTTTTNTHVGRCVVVLTGDAQSLSRFSLLSSRPPASAPSLAHFAALLPRSSTPHSLPFAVKSPGLASHGAVWHIALAAGTDVRRDHVAVSTDNPPTDLTSPPLIPPFPHLPCSFHRLSRAASTPRSESSTSLLVSTIPSSNLRPVSAAPCRVTHVCSGSHPAAMSCACAPTRAEPNLAPADRLSALPSPVLHFIIAILRSSWCS
jgi:hypothetical protein